MTESPPPSPSRSRRLAAIWFADVVGYTRLSAEHPRTAIEVIDRLQEVAREVVEASGGEVVKFLGDGIFAAFPSAAASVLAALRFQEAYAERIREVWPSHHGLRIGVHLGEIFSSPGGDLFGDGVNRAARLEPLAAPGEVVVSEDVWRHLHRDEELRFTLLGRRALEGIEGTVQVWRAERETGRGALAGDRTAAPGRIHRWGTAAREAVEDLRRRHVFHVATVYLLAAWGAIEVVGTLDPVLGIPDWLVRGLVLTILFGFPVAVALAWIFEWSGGGLETDPRRLAGADTRFSVAGGVAVLFAVGVAAGAGIWWSRGLPVGGGEEAVPEVVPADAAARPVVAVLPFGIISSDPASREYFAAGLHEQVISELARVPDIRVISRTSVIRYAASEDPVDALRRETGADAVLEGSIRFEGDRVRVSTHLVDPLSGHTLWTEEFDGEEGEVFSIQGEVALAVAEGVVSDLSPETRLRLSPPPTRDPEAYHLFLQARHTYNDLGTPGSITRSQGLFREALERDPDFALAYAGLADTWLASAHLGVEPHIAFPRADSAAIQAIARDPELAEAHAALADTRFHYEWAWESSDQQFRRARDLGPGHSTTYWWHAGLLAALGRFDEAVRRLREAAEMDPASPLFRAFGSRVLTWAGRLDEAERWAGTARELAPGNPYAAASMGWVLLTRGEGESAVEHFRSAADANPRVFLADLVAALAAADRESEARALMDSVRTIAAKGYVPPYRRAFAHLALGDTARALDLLEEATRTRDAELIWVGVDPFLAPLRDHPRFRAVLDTMGLADRLERAAGRLATGTLIPPRRAPASRRSGSPP